MSHTPQSPHEVFTLQRQAHDQAPYPSIATRVDRIDRLIDLLLSNKTALCEAVNADFGQRSADNTLAVDIMPPLHSLKYAKKHIHQWVKTRKHKANFPYNLLGSKAYVQPVPLGVVGNISPWNFPITLAFSPMGGILGAGNRVMIKPSEFTPATSELMQTLVAKQFDTSEVAVITGDAQVAAEFSQLPFDHLLFTGSTSVARKVSASCAPNLVPATLELGGKSPVLVSDTADISDVAGKVMYAKTLNCGQICLAPDYLLINAASVDALVNEMKSVTQSLYPQGTNSPDYVNIIQQRHVARLQAHLEDSRERGNQIIPLLDNDSDDPRRLAPHLVIVKDRDASIMQEELFGPLLPIVPIKQFDDIYPLVRERRNPLAVYYFGKSSQEMHDIQTRINSGGLVINELLWHFSQDDLPFGGVGDSGTGAYHGEQGFKQFSHFKSVFTAPKIDIGKMFRPPYTDKFRNAVNSQLKK